MQLVFFHTADRPFQAKSKKFIKNFIAKIFLSEGKSFQRADFIFCSDQYLLGINQSFLQHDFFTDIITFPLSEPGCPIVAEIYISLDRVKENAAIHNVSFFNETLRVLCHGTLHLCGYGDKTKAQHAQMKAKEDFYIELFHVKQ